MPTLVLFLELAAIAIVFAGLPLAYLWTRPGYSFFQKLNWALVFMTFDLIVFGAFTRLSDSGLGCPDWPGYIYLLSLARTRKSDCLNATEECDLERVETFSEYANAGLDLIRREALFGYKTLEFAQKLMELSDDGSSQQPEDLKI